VINAIVCIGCFQLMIIYFIIIGDIITSFSLEIFNGHVGILVSRTFYILLVAGFLSPQIFKKEMHELKITSFFLFASISLFVVVFAQEVLLSGHITADDIASPKPGIGLVTAVSVFITAYQYQFNLYATVKSMRRPAERYKAITLGLVMVITIYTTLSILSLLLFGSTVRPDVMQNVSLMADSLESSVLRIAFTLVIMCHVPFAFFSCKDAFLLILDEMDRRSISRELGLRITGGVKEYQGEMRPVLYYSGTVLIYLFSVLLAVAIRDVGVVFSIGAAIAGSSAQFIWPGYFYLKSENGSLRVMAWLQLAVGVALFFGLLAGTLYGMI
jgi:amino acid permease